VDFGSQNDFICLFRERVEQLREIESVILLLVPREILYLVPMADGAFGAQIDNGDYLGEHSSK